MLEVFCVYDLRKAPVRLGLGHENDLSDEKTEKHCHVQLSRTSKQLVFFLQGELKAELKNPLIDITITSGKQTEKLCTLSKTVRCFSWTVKNADSQFNIPSSGKVSFITTFCNEPFTKRGQPKVTETVSDSVHLKTSSTGCEESLVSEKDLPKATHSLSEEPVPQARTSVLSSEAQSTGSVSSFCLGKLCETPTVQTPEKSPQSPSSPPIIQNSSSEHLKKEVTDVASPLPAAMSGNKELQKMNETTPVIENSLDCKSPLPSRPKKRSREESTTPKPKSRRQRLAMRALNEKITPTKKELKDEKSSEDPKKNSFSVGKTQSLSVRCVDLSSRAPKPTSRWGHSLCGVNNQMVVLIGGQGEKQLSRDSIWFLDPEMRTWKCPEVSTEGAKPEYRVGHSATYDPTMRCIYVFGGSKNTKWFRDVNMFDLDELKWSLVKANGKAPTRAYHSTTLFRHELWIFGGVFPRPDPQPDGCDNDIHIFSPVMESWYKPLVTGEKPAPRSGHSATLMNDLLVVFGGWDFPYCYNDIFILDMTTVDWSSPQVFGQPPKPRSWHASCPLTNNRIFIHGGYDGDNALHDAHVFDLESKTWQELSIASGPSARAGHKCLRLASDYENQGEDEIIIFGGGDNDGSFFNDLLSFYVPYEAKDVDDMSQL